MLPNHVICFEKSFLRFGMHSVLEPTYWAITTQQTTPLQCFSFNARDEKTSIKGSATMRWSSFVFVTISVFPHMRGNKSCTATIN
jgi:hypothetical protein